MAGPKPARGRRCRSLPTSGREQPALLANQGLIFQPSSAMTPFSRGPFLHPSSSGTFRRGRTESVAHMEQMELGFFVSEAPEMSRKPKQGLDSAVCGAVGSFKGKTSASS